MRLFSNGDFLRLTRAQAGWHVYVYFEAETDRQFTKEPFSYETGSRWAWLALLKGYIGARSQKRRIEAEAVSGRMAKGWGT